MGIASCVRAYLGSRIGVCQRPSTSIRQRASCRSWSRRAPAHRSYSSSSLTGTESALGSKSRRSTPPRAARSSALLTRVWLGNQVWNLALATGLTASGTPPLGLVVSLSRMRIGSLKNISFIRSSQNHNILDCGASLRSLRIYCHPSS